MALMSWTRTQPVVFIHDASGRHRSRVPEPRSTRGMIALLRKVASRVVNAFSSLVR